MKPKKNISYFPVDASEQALLIRVREPDFEGRVGELVEMVDQIAEAHLGPAELGQAIQLFAESRRGVGIDGRFDNLEGRLKERIERGLVEIEGRLSRRLRDESVVETPAPLPPTPTPQPLVATPPAIGDVPKEASLAIRVGSDLLSGTTAAQFYVEVWRWLFEHSFVKPADLPIRSGRSRYEVATEAFHSSGTAFFAAKEIIPGVWLEAHLSRADILRRARKYLSQYGVQFDVVVGTEG